METARTSDCSTKTLAELETQVRELEESLRKTRASAVALRARLLAEGSPELDALETTPTDTPVETTSDAPHVAEGLVDDQLPSVTLAPLLPLHVLRNKWRLQADFPLPSVEEKTPDEESPRSAARHEGRVRLFGLLEDGSPWECSILYSHLMKADGITLGRESTDADIVLNDPSISRCHLRLELTDEGVVVTDENSTNGTWVNNLEIGAYNRRVPLNDGDILGVAEIGLKVELL